VPDVAPGPLAVGLTTALHRAGLPVTPERAAGLARALRLVPPVDRGALYWTCRMLDAGADPNIRDDKYDATALGWAQFFGRQDFSDLIRDKGGLA